MQWDEDQGANPFPLLEVPPLSPSSREGEAVRFLLPFYSCIFVGGPWQVFRKK